MMARRIPVWLALVATGCGDAGGPSAKPALTVFAAASTTDVVIELGRGFADASLRTSTGPSSGLARQIRDGAPADILVSASRQWVEYLQRAGAIAGEPVPVGKNRLVCVVAHGSALLQAPPTDAAALAERIARGDRIAIADDGVPAGEYARQSLAKTGAMPAVRPHLVALDDVRSVVRAVATGQAVAGFVYATDARSAEVEELFAFPPRSHEPIEYVAAVTSTSTRPELAREFLEYLASPAAIAVLTEAGFDVVPR